MRPVRVLLALFVLLMLSGIAMLPSQAGANHGEGHIGLQGVAWDHTQITYQVKAGSGVYAAAIVEAISAAGSWNAAIDALTDHDDFQLVPATGRKADITISIRSGGGDSGVYGIVGKTSLSTRGGKIQSASITISGGALAYSYSSMMAGNLVRHELGHALGIGNADFSDISTIDGFTGAVMQPSAPLDAHTSPIPITACDATAFAAAHAYYPGSFVPPVTTKVDC